MLHATVGRWYLSLEVNGHETPEEGSQSITWSRHVDIIQSIRK